MLIMIWRRRNLRRSSSCSTSRAELASLEIDFSGSDCSIGLLIDTGEDRILHSKLPGRTDYNWCLPLIPWFEHLVAASYNEFQASPGQIHGRTKSVMDR